MWGVELIWMRGGKPSGSHVARMELVHVVCLAQFVSTVNLRELHVQQIRHLSLILD